MNIANDQKSFRCKRVIVWQLANCFLRTILSRKPNFLKKKSDQLTWRVLNFVGRKKLVFFCFCFCFCFCFLPKIVYFSIWLTTNKLYWIENQLIDVSTRFYTLVSWRWRVEPSATRLNTVKYWEKNCFFLFLFLFFTKNRLLFYMINY